MAANAIEALGALCVITAADIEFKLVAKLLSAARPTVEQGLQLVRGQAGVRPVVLLKTEIGAVGFAEKLRTHLAENQYAALVVIGLAGALDPTLKTGDVVLYDRCLDGRGRSAAVPQNIAHVEKRACIPCDVQFGKLLFERIGGQGLRCQRATGLSEERVVTEADQKHAFYEQTQASAVDMETYLVLATVAEFKLPCTAVRVVMDEAASDLPDFNAGLDAAGRVQLWPTLWALVARPRATLTFFRSLRPALRNLERATRAVFQALNSR